MDEAKGIYTLALLVLDVAKDHAKYAWGKFQLSECSKAYVLEAEARVKVAETSVKEALDNVESYERPKAKALTVEARVKETEGEALEAAWVLAKDKVKELWDKVRFSGYPEAYALAAEIEARARARDVGAWAEKLKREVAAEKLKRLLG